MAWTAPNDPTAATEPCEDVPPADNGWAATFRALRHRNYRLYFGGQAVSLFGSWMQMPALMWLTFTLSGQSRWPAWVAAAHFLPTFLLGFWGGSLADRWPKRTILFWTQTGLALLPLVLVALVLAGVRAPAAYLAVAVLVGLVLAVDFPARLSFVVDMVGRGDVTNAVALNALLFNAARLLGPLAADLVLRTYGPALCFWVNSATYLGLLGALLLMDERQLPARLPQPPERPDVLGGFRHVARRPELLALLACTALMGTLGWPYLALLPAIAGKALNLPHSGYTWLLSATGLGALSAALTVAAFGRSLRSRYFIGGGVALVSLGLLGLAGAHQLAAALGCCLLIGFGLILFFSTAQATLQLSADAHNRGQVMGVWAMVVSGAPPLGNLIAGPSADRWGEQQVLLAQGVTLAVVALVGLALFLRRRRRAAPLD